MRELLADTQFREVFLLTKHWGGGSPAVIPLKGNLFIREVCGFFCGRSRVIDPSRISGIKTNEAIHGWLGGRGLRVNDSSSETEVRISFGAWDFVMRDGEKMFLDGTFTCRAYEGDVQFPDLPSDIFGPLAEFVDGHLIAGFSRSVRVPEL